MQLFYLALPIVSVHDMFFLSREHIGRFDAFLKRMFNYGYCQQLYTLSGLCKQYDKTLSKIILNSQSCIHQLLPSESSSHMQLRPRAHNFTLPICKTVWYKNSFVNHFLFPMYLNYVFFYFMNSVSLVTAVNVFVVCK